MVQCHGMTASYEISRFRFAPLEMTMETRNRYTPVAHDMGLFCLIGQLPHTPVQSKVGISSSVAASGDCQ